jgi:hypothetical protein
MKKILYLVGFLFLVNTSQAQLESRYDFGNAPPLLDECNAQGKPTGNKFAPPAGASFKITTTLIDGETVIATCLLYGSVNNDTLEFKKNEDYINYLKYNTSISAVKNIENKYLKYKKTEEDKKAKNKEERNKKEKDSIYKEQPQENFKIPLSEVDESKLYFLIKVSDLAKFSTPFFQTWHQNRTFVVGAQTNLLKIRIKDFNFADQFSLATNFGFRYRTNPKKDNFLTFITSIGISLNNLDSLVAPKLPATEKLNNIGSLSVGLGIIKEFNKIQLSFMLGKDFLSKSNNKKYDWIYQGKTWISFGIGVGVFTNDDGKKSSKTDSQ